MNADAAALCATVVALSIGLAAARRAAPPATARRWPFSSVWARSGRSTCAPRTPAGLERYRPDLSRIGKVEGADESCVICVPGAPADKKCSNGRIVQTTIDSLARTDIDPVPFATDLYTWTPGVANSLVRLTTDLP